MSDGLREYGLKVAKKGLVVLACGKCQRKMSGKLGKVKKALKKRVGNEVKVLSVGCLKVCPKGGVVICTQEQVGRGVCSILWSGEDLDLLAARVGAASNGNDNGNGEMRGSLHSASLRSR